MPTTSSIVTANNKSSLTINNPGNPGDLLVANVYLTSGPGTYATGGTGWANISQLNLAGSTSRLESVQYHVAAAGETSYTFSWTGGNATYAVGFIVAFSGVDPTTPLDGVTPSSGTNGSGSNPASTPGSITTVSANDAVVMFVAAEAASPAITISGYSTTSPGALTALLAVARRELWQRRRRMGAESDCWRTGPAPRR